MSPHQATGHAVVVVMAKQPAVGRTKTRLCPPLSAVEAAELYQALLDDTITLVSRLRRFRLAAAVTPPAAIDAMRASVPRDALLVPVAGADIGACLDQATGHLFARGFCRVIALNSDGPTLPAEHIERAEALLEQADVVLGPNVDGGYYLIGLRRPCPDLFRDIAWSTGRVAAQTLDRAAALGLSVALLPPWYDVDTAADLERLRIELAGLPPQALTCTRRFFAREEVRRRDDARRERVCPRGLGGPAAEGEQPMSARSLCLSRFGGLAVGQEDEQKRYFREKRLYTLQVESTNACPAGCVYCYAGSDPEGHVGACLAGHSRAPARCRMPRCSRY